MKPHLFGEKMPRNLIHNVFLHLFEKEQFIRKLPKRKILLLLLPSVVVHNPLIVVYYF
jgi:hypothetical protein